MSEYTNEKRTYVAGYVTAYGAAKRGGYTGTYDEFCADMAHLAGMTAQATTLDAGESATASYDDGVLSLGIPKGDKGEKGDDGGLSAEAIANEYDPSETYAIGDYCINDGALYKCAVGIATPEEWTAAHWTAVSMTEEVSDLKAATLIPSTASGAIASFPDGADLPIRGLEVGIEPVQDLHGYGSPWPAGGGVNKIDVNQLKSYGTTYGLTVSFDGDWIVLTGEYATSSQVANFRIANLKDGSAFPVTKFKAFPDSSTSSHMTPNAFGIADNNKTLTIYITNMVQGETYNLRTKIVGYEGETAPTAWTPYSNICPITGWTGANVWRCGENLIDDSIKYQYNSTIVVVGANNYDFNIFLKAGQYTFSASFLNGVHYGAFVREQNGTTNRAIWISDGTATTGTFTLRSDGLCRFWFFHSKGATASNIEWCKLELGSTATAYEPYQGITIPISWQSEAGTVYGGSLDVTSGVLVVDRALLTKNTSTMDNYEDYPGWQNSGVKALIGDGLNDVFINQKLNVGTVFAANTRNADILFLPCNGTYSYGKTQSEWIALAMDIQILVKLATPLTIQLPPSTLRTLYGQNNVWADTGNIVVDYYADTKLYIEKLTAPTEDDMTANSNIQSGKYFMVGNTLYLSTAAIAANETIKPGTNCTRVSLADALNSLNA